MGSKKSKKDNVIKFPVPQKGEDKKAKTGNKPDHVSTRPPDFAGFAIAILNNRLDEAGEILASIFNIDKQMARKAAEHYGHLYKTVPGVQEKAMKLRSEIEKNNINAALLLLHELFGLQGPIAITVIDSLKKRV